LTIEIQCTYNGYTNDRTITSADMTTNSNKSRS